MPHQFSVVFISDIHPSMQHVSAQRVWNFACQLALAGRKVTILTQVETDHLAPTQVDELSEIVMSHDWKSPLIVTTSVPKNTLLSNARTGKIPWGLRQAVLAAAQFRRGGHFQDWFDAARSLSRAVSETIKPNVVIGTFGNLGNWAIAQTLAAQSGCPWIGDLKDNWRVFSLPGFRHYNAFRFRNMAHMTTYSYTHAEIAAQFFSTEKSVVYSGYHKIENSSEMTSIPRGFMFSGSLYGTNKLRMIFDGMEMWAGQHERTGRRQSLKLIYAGNEGARLNALAKSFGDLFSVFDLGYLDPIDLMRAHRRAICNIYIVNPNSLFQQKFFDLVSVDRPIISVPKEGDEEIGIAEFLGAKYFGCENASDVARSIEAAFSAQDGGLNQDAVKTYSWAQQASRLGSVLDHVIGARR